MSELIKVFQPQALRRIENAGKVETAKPLAKLLVLGDFRPDQIEVVMTANRMPRDEALADLIKKRKTQLKRNESRPRLEDYRVTEDGRLVMTCGITDFAEYRETRDFETFRKLGLEGSSGALTVDVGIHTADNKIITSVKLDPKTDAAGSRGVPGGGVKLTFDKYRNPQPFDMLGAGLDEVREELGITPEEFEEIKLLGLGMQYGPFCHPFGIMYARTHLTSEQIAERWETIRKREIIPVAVGLTEVNKTYTPIVKSERLPVEPDERLAATLSRDYAQGIRYQAIALRSLNQI